MLNLVRNAEDRLSRDHPDWVFTYRGTGRFEVDFDNLFLAP